MALTVCSRGVLALAFLALVTATPNVGRNAEGSFWKGTAMDSVVDEIRTECERKDAVACIKMKALNFLDQVLRKDSFKVSENMAVVKNSYEKPEGSEMRSSGSFLDHVEQYVQSHDVVAEVPSGLPFSGSKVTFSSRNMDQDELNFSVKFPGSEGKAVSEARKGKLKKIIVPILVFVLLKAMTLIPLAIGVLGLKAWNALQLSFFSFVISVALAIFQLCKKIAADSSAQVGPHGFDGYSAHYAAARLFPEVAVPEGVDAQDLAYRGYQ
ncbi:uncharacterized protein Osi19 [Hetaerina americana]|uniref:uncharacterized protein Osi19 n=1 Tax=Hetaerina americana TaxID=62018 RepID=UPI003A7F37CA